MALIWNEIKDRAFTSDGNKIDFLSSLYGKYIANLTS